SWKHTKDEQRAERERWRREQRDRGLSSKGYKAYVQNAENPKEDQSSSDSELSDSESDDFDDGRSVTTSHFMTLQGAELLADEAFRHRISATQDQSTTELTDHPEQTFMQNSLEWEGFLPDTGAAEHSTAGFRQFVALQRQQPGLHMDRGRAGEARIRGDSRKKAGGGGTSESRDLLAGMPGGALVAPPRGRARFAADREVAGTLFTREGRTETTQAGPGPDRTGSRAGAGGGGGGTRYTPIVRSKRSDGK
ncbi:hypothetical protein PspLS_12156, partial [Pyricularia sp. CBS 133598]